MGGRIEVRYFSDSCFGSFTLIVPFISFFFIFFLIPLQVAQELVHRAVLDEGGLVLKALLRAMKERKRQREAVGERERLGAKPLMIRVQNDNYRARATALDGKSKSVEQEIEEKLPPTLPDTADYEMRLLGNGESERENEIEMEMLWTKHEQLYPDLKRRGAEWEREIRGRVEKWRNEFYESQRKKSKAASVMMQETSAHTAPQPFEMESAPSDYQTERAELVIVQAIQIGAEVDPSPLQAATVSDPVVGQPTTPILPTQAYKSTKPRRNRDISNVVDEDPSYRLYYPKKSQTSPSSSHLAPKSLTSTGCDTALRPQLAKETTTSTAVTQYHPSSTLIDPTESRPRLLTERVDSTGGVPPINQLDLQSANLAPGCAMDTAADHTIANDDEALSHPLASEGQPAILADKSATNLESGKPFTSNPLASVKTRMRPRRAEQPTMLKEGSQASEINGTGFETGSVATLPVRTFRRPVVQKGKQARNETKATTPTLILPDRPEARLNQTLAECDSNDRPALADYEMLQVDKAISSEIEPTKRSPGSLHYKPLVKPSAQNHEIAGVLVGKLPDPCNWQGRPTKKPPKRASESSELNPPVESPGSGTESNSDESVSDKSLFDEELETDSEPLLRPQAASIRKILFQNVHEMSICGRNFKQKDVFELFYCEGARYDRVVFEVYDMFEAIPASGSSLAAQEASYIQGVMYRLFSDYRDCQMFGSTPPPSAVYPHGNEAFMLNFNRLGGQTIAESCLLTSHQGYYQRSATRRPNIQGRLSG
ncbi:hypothetical protein C8J57DRAFT_594206 [Mycena rebaudengoi]|nr:hypothetical protein C8J57DRAFT_594206 [Mycena rebaudengoi]